MSIAYAENLFMPFMNSPWPDEKGPCIKARSQRVVSGGEEPSQGRQDAMASSEATVHSGRFLAEDAPNEIQILHVEKHYTSWFLTENSNSWNTGGH